MLVGKINAQAKNGAIFPTRLAIDIRPSKSPFIRENVERIALVEAWRSFLLQKIKALNANTPPEQLLFAALISSSLCGCLIDSRKIIDLANRINVPIQRAGKLAYFDFSLPYRNLTGSLLQRWFPDPLTEMLLVRAKITQHQTN